MNITCPYCDRDRSTNKVIEPGTKVRCPGCKNVFTPVPVPTPVEAEILAVVPDPEPKPPPEIVPSRTLPPKTKQLHGAISSPWKLRGRPWRLSWSVHWSVRLYSSSIGTRTPSRP